MMKSLTRMIVTMLCLLVLYACNNASGTKKTVTHWAAINYKKGKLIYADAVQSGSVMQRTKSDEINNDSFFCYKISLIDSTLHEQKEDLERNKYFDYEMQKNWVVLLNGDSVHAVFFQLMIKKNKMLQEGVLVFELPSTAKPDSLIYRNTIDPNNPETIVLNHKKY